VNVIIPNADQKIVMNPNEAEVESTLNVSQPEAESRFATTSAPPPSSEVRYLLNFVDFNCT